MDDVGERPAVDWVRDSFVSACIGCFQANPPFVLRAGVLIGAGAVATQMTVATQGWWTIISLFATSGLEGIHDAPTR